MTADKNFRLQVEVNPLTGKVEKAHIDRDFSGNFEEVELDSDALGKILQGGDAAIDVVAQRTGSDPRRLPR